MSGRGAQAFRAVRQAVDRLERALLAALVTGMVGLAALQILLRNVWKTGLNWIDPFLGMVCGILTRFVTMTLLGV